MTAAAPLLVATWAAPLALLVACLSPSVRARMPAWLWVAPLPGLAAALFAHSAPAWVIDASRLRLTLGLDPAGAALLGVCALLWSAAGAYAGTSLRGDANAGRFAEWWLLTLAGSLGVFVAQDLASFYVAFAMLSLAAWGLVVHDETARARRAGALYLGLAVLGEIFLLLGFAVLAAESPGDSLAIRDVVAALPTLPGRGFALAFLLAGFGLKAGLLPLHVWLPIAHPAAPTPASAVLSGAIVKAGVIGLIRFLPPDPALAGWGAGLAALGLATAYYAAAVGLAQANPKTVLAYSSVSQLGGIAALLGMGVYAGDGAAVGAATLAALNHVLVKGALFLGVGVVAATGRRRPLALLAPITVLALALGGLPLTGGALAKLAAKPVLGPGLVGALGALSAAATTLLMLHFVARLARSAAQDPTARAPQGLVAPWLALSVAAVALPSALAPAVAAVSESEAFAPGALWAAAWPILAGAALAFGLRRVALPSVPEGDIVVLGRGAARSARSLGDALERVDEGLREWPAAGAALLGLVILIGAAVLAGS